MARITSSLVAAGLALCAARLADAQSPPTAGPYHVAEIFQIGGAGGWDYVTVDAEHKHLYVPRTTHTMVLDTATGKSVADIPGQRATTAWPSSQAPAAASSRTARTAPSSFST